MKSGEKKLEGIGGWLIFVIIGLCVSIVRIALLVFRDHLGLFRDGTWAALTNPGSELYHPLWKPLITFEIVGNGVTLLLAVATLVFLLKRSRYTPHMAISWLLAGLALVVADYFLAQRIPLIAQQPTDPETIREITRSAIGVLIWVPYFLISKRVKATFTREWPGNSSEPTRLGGEA